MPEPQRGRESERDGEREGVDLLCDAMEMTRNGHNILPTKEKEKGKKRKERMRIANMKKTKTKKRKKKKEGTGGTDGLKLLSRNIIWTTWET